MTYKYSYFKNRDGYFAKITYHDLKDDDEGYYQDSPKYSLRKLISLAKSSENESIIHMLKNLLIYKSLKDKNCKKTSLGLKK